MLKNVQLKHLFLMLPVVMLLGACDPGGSFDVDDPFKIAYKQTLVNARNHLKIKFEGVLSDSRCPIDAQCVWAGNAEVKLTFTNGSKREKFVLNTGLEPTVHEAFGYLISLNDLTPQPSLDHSPKPRDYVAVLTISTSDGGCSDNVDCAAVDGNGVYCRKAVGDCSGMGRCSEKPTACTFEYNPVCGCNGRTYGNACSAAANGVNVAYTGECREEPRDTRCDDGTTPLCEMIPPVCEEGDILAYQNNCYRCVDPDTCQP